MLFVCDPARWYGAVWEAISALVSVPASYASSCVFRVWSCRATSAIEPDSEG